MVTTQRLPRATTFGYIEPLDGLRGLLVFPVALHHFSLNSGADFLLFKGGFFAPSVFFALSGFLITSLLLVEKERTGGLDWRGFWRRRFRRLIPASVSTVFFVALIGALWPGAWHGLLPVSDTVAALLSYYNWQSISVEGEHPFRLLGPLGPFWSLAVEEQFYLGLSIVVAIAARTNDTLRWLTGMLVAVGLFSVASLIVHDDTLVREFFGTDTRASELVAGCLLAVVIHRYGWPSGRGWVVAGWVAMAALISLWLFIPADAGWVLGGGLALISLINVPLLCGAIVPGSLARALSFRPLVELGKLSYPVYLVHWPVALLMSSERMGMTGWPLIIVRFVVSVVLGYAVYRFIERPMRTRSALPGATAVYVWVGLGLAAVALSAIGAARG